MRRLIGSRYSRDTLRIREFLCKNRVPFTWLDLEATLRWTSCSGSSG
jgi:hypothetical protein